ncbi:MAG: NAD(P)H-hydrate dehydratase [Candidatus Omnitrophica bacterium]|nr:NAD(P)H-hydrate dehydratase [Candidatus Omnitrophota bacterium]
MRLPTPLLRCNSKSHKNTFGHVLVIAGSKRMLGAGVLSSLSAIRSGAGLVTLGIPKSLNAIAQKKISPVIMTWPLKETKEQTISCSALNDIKKELSKYQSVAIGPGLSQNKETKRFILKAISSIKNPMVIDADALNALSENISILETKGGVRVLTPHLGEMARLTGKTKTYVESNRESVAKTFAKKYDCILVLKGSRTVVASSWGKIYVNKTGNSGLATAGTGDVLTGMITAFLAQGLSGFDASKYATFLHGKAGDIAAKKKTKVSLIATDLIDNIPAAFKKALQD